MTGNMAASKAGHDKGGLYIIIREDEEYVYLCDGRLKKLANPKRKNKKHIQIIETDVDKELKNRLQNGEDGRDEEIRRAVKLYEMKDHKQI